MNRHEAREQSFILVFEKAFNSDMTLDELLEYSKETGVLQENNFTTALAETTLEHLNEIDEMIEKYSIGWSKQRISKVPLSILRIALAEMFFMDDVPIGVSINEAVELAKIYAAEKDAAFINGILGTAAKSAEADKDE